MDQPISNQSPELKVSLPNTFQNNTSQKASAQQPISNLPAPVVPAQKSLATSVEASSSNKNSSSAKPSYWTTIKSWLIECKRVLNATKKPDMDEFKTIVKVSGLGILIIGFIGFLIAMAKELLF